MATEHVLLVLVASPLLGPAVWRPVAGELGERGWDVVVPAPYGEVKEPADVVEHLLAAAPEDAPVVLVPHSNAGLYVAALAAELDVRGVVFVDAGLPARAATTPTAPEPFREFLAGLADERGLLPVWTQWWPSDDVDGLFPGERSRAAVEAEQVRLPLAYFDAAVPSPSGWEAAPAAYLAFGHTYDEEHAEARRRGWPVARLEGGHLHPLADPGGVAEALEGLLWQIGISGAGGSPIRV